MAIAVASFTITELTFSFYHFGSSSAEGLHFSALVHSFIHSLCHSVNSRSLIADAYQALQLRTSRELDKVSPFNVPKLFVKAWIFTKSE